MSIEHEAPTTERYAGEYHLDLNTLRFDQITDQAKPALNKRVLEASER